MIKKPTTAGMRLKLREAAQRDLLSRRVTENQLKSKSQKIKLRRLIAEMKKKGKIEYQPKVEKRLPRPTL